MKVALKLNAKTMMAHSLWLMRRFHQNIIVNDRAFGSAGFCASVKAASLLKCVGGRLLGFVELLRSLMNTQDKAGWLVGVIVVF